jgi:DNA-directed RNA polymerase specialized sigma24 family protein
MDSEITRRMPHGPPPPAERVWSEFLAALHELPADARAVLLLHDVFGAGLDDIGSTIGMTTDACAQRLHQARCCLQARARNLELKTT